MFSDAGTARFGPHRFPPMKDLTHSLALMTGLRDREALEDALVDLLFQAWGPSVQAVRLFRVVVDAGRNCCLPVLERHASDPEPRRSDANPLPGELPALDTQPLLQQAFTAGTTQVQAGPPWVCCVPLVEGVPALLEVGFREPQTPADVSWLEDLFRVYGNVVALLDYGEKDTLTELLNRKTFDVAFIKAAAGLKPAPAKAPPQERRQSPQVRGAWLAVLDIDHFKRVNDGFGHLIGDEVLLLVARLMRACSRHSDLLYRFGGEEFVILMRCDSETDALSAMERLRTTIANHRFPQVGTITASIGLTEVFHNDIPSEAFGRADEAVYYAKSHGRNQVRSYQQLVAQGELVAHVKEGMVVDLF